ncbi:hypothetical protein SPRG_00473 [Saprolegnia parasitica CBS 223.65]|uniref:C2H2-type domain-containing protein n=1 Tax=Saprolegnia parasitica (strain CBS 223.65) TaxID=695850 RepID=A0A067CY45_SAPPC|nr:hypothetical protein SPRG_00473 [Saprolegnia parasitica CBS 223.65]KDO35629.1 hypothetical protein SPRG_00473 [Saprolegnia parasitica CBS 223.65]|eukprot:XP_012193957.1 hypothetical protein SPRG_00473 [Saprolegnia parasitica CBS 223.65]
MLPLGYLLMAAAAIATYAVLSIGPVEFVASPPPYGLNACTACGLRLSVLCPTSLFAHLENLSKHLGL